MLIGTAVVGATTMIFSIIVVLTNRLQPRTLQMLSILHPPFLLGLITGGCDDLLVHRRLDAGGHDRRLPRGRVHQGEHQARRRARRPRSPTRKKVVEICTQYAQKGMFNIFLAVFFATLGFAFLEPYFFIGYLISIALFGLYQAIFMANAGGAWDNAKKIVEVELKEKGTPLHAATVVGDTVGDPFKDTSSVAMNPIIKFTTLFGLLAVELGVQLDTAVRGRMMSHLLSAAFVSGLGDFRLAVVLRDADQGGRLKIGVELGRETGGRIRQKLVSKCHGGRSLTPVFAL